MSFVESVVYYPSCPQCGAANSGKDTCEYCGSSLIKSKTNKETTNTLASEEEANFQADSIYPEVQGKLFVKDDFIFFFCPIFGGIFLLVPTIILFVFSSVGILLPWVIMMLSVFWLIGFAGIYPLINYFVKKSKCQNGREIAGIVRGYEQTMVSVNGSPVLKVRLLVDERTNPKILVLNTGSTKRLYPLGKVVKLKGDNNNFIIANEKL